VLFRAFLASLILHLVLVFGARNLPVFLLPAPGASAPLMTGKLLQPIASGTSKAEISIAATTGEKVSVLSGAKPSAPSSSLIKPKVFDANSRLTVADALQNSNSPKTLPARQETSKIAEEPVSSDDLRQYRLNLAREAKRFKHYPALAHTQGWEGVVIIDVAYSSVASLGQVTLGQGSGFSVLDEQALEMMTQAVRLTVLPEQLRGRRFVVSTPIQYRLGD